MSVGDVNSQEPGSGARYNDGKPRFDLIPVAFIEVYERLRKARNRCNGPDQFDRLHMIQMEKVHYEYPVLAVLDMYYGDETAALAEIAAVFEYGAKKYAAWNWAKGMKWSIPVACAARHAVAGANGEENDSESGLPHRAHFGCNMVMLWYFMIYYEEGNDLPSCIPGVASAET